MSELVQESTVLEGIHCEVCSNTEKNKFRAKYKGPNYEVFACAKCDFEFIPPYYRQQIKYTQYKDEAVGQAVRAGNNWVKIQRHKLRLRFIRKFVPKGSLFDLGAGWGHFMLAAKEMGYTVSGIEIAEQPYKYCVQDLQLPVEHLDFFKLPEDRIYDIVTLWDVLEHIDAASAFLKKCNQHTRPGGYLFLQVPQIDSYIARKQGGTWKMRGLDHVNYFSKKTMARILEQNGYELVKIKSSFEIKLFLMYTVLPFFKRVRGKQKQSLKETNTTINAAERQRYFNRFTKVPHWILVIFMALHNLLYNTLSFLGVGEEMMVAARKVREA